jgi:SSS family solute:Na+ symporter
MVEDLTSTLGFLDYAIVILYLLGMIAIGIWIARKVKSFTSFFVAGRMMTTPLLISTLVSTYYGLDVTFGVSEVSFEEGVVAWFVYSRPYYLAILITALFLVPRLKAFPFLSLADIVEHFYGKTSRVTVALASFLYNLPILSIMGMGILFRVTLGLSEIEGYLLGATIAVIYTLLGGLWADAITDTVQFALMCVTLAVALPFALEMVGGFDWILSGMETKYFEPMGDVAPVYLFALVFTAFSVFVEPAFYQRIFSARDARSVRHALLIGVLLWGAYDWAVTVLGIAAAAAVKQGLLSADLRGREALIQIVLISLPIGLKGFFIAGILSAAMSTVDSYLLLSSGNLIYDIYRPVFRPSMSDAALLKWTRIGIVIALIPCLAIAVYFQRITDAWVFMSTVLTATALIPIMAALFLPGGRKPWEGLFSSLFGLATVLLYYGLTSFLGRSEKDSYLWTVSLFSCSWDLWREYSLFFALPASAFGFILGSSLSALRRKQG